MAKPMTADQTLAAMKKWHVPYREYPGWKTRGRDPEHGPFSDVHGIVIHHTGSDAGQSDAYLQFLAVDGRPGLPGPLCNVSADMDGDLHLIAQGRANHAGSGSNAVLQHVIKEDYDGYKAELKPGPDAVDGNAVYYGNEVRYDGGQPMTDKAYRSALLHAAAVCDFHGWSALAAIGHREHTTRKPDPGNCPMNNFRTDLAAVLRIGPSVVWSGKTPKAPATKPPVTTPPKGAPAVSDPDIYAAHLHAKSAAVQAEALLSRLALAVPARPPVTGTGDAFGAHYWAKRAATLLPLVAAELARLGYPKKV